ncbi:hypothetical protein [Halopseudomonas salegens]|uniref:Uncharacterized protein n=1 Tax=Halopseudomonas salegens TaxID=1434072 RepID=A0A1H2F3V7_9GAMM|nr:hypothetical protein [Halopseudomonas salegens]SDU02076.1 hypothetical protein SAMN05216210_1268 [Halopseudomonas salegens]
MNSNRLETEEKVLREFLKWSGGPEDDVKAKKKDKIQAYILATLFFVVTATLLYLDPPNLYQVLAGLSLIIGIVFMAMANIIAGSTHNLEYTRPFIDADAIRARIKDIENSQPDQQGPSGWTH